MIQSGNPNQWVNGYPQSERAAEDIRQGGSYLFVTPAGTIVGTFALLAGPEPTYHTIYNGAWLNEEPYHVIHRLASDGSVSGLGNRCMEFCIRHARNLRLDTHEQNRIVQSLAERYGFTRCGIVYMPNGTPRIAYQRLPR